MGATIAVDAMGGDYGPDVTVPGALDALEQDPGIRLILVGNQQQIESALKKSDRQNGRVRVQHASQTVTMDETPARALRGKKDSSMRVAINLVKAGEADACVSAGNSDASSGALIVPSKSEPSATCSAPSRLTA